MVDSKKKISLEELLKGLEQDEEYGVHCHVLLEKYATKHHIKFEGSAPASECLKDLLGILLVYERFPFYYQGEVEPVELDVDIKAKDILSGHYSLDFEIVKSQLKHFLYKSRLPLPAPTSQKENPFWFHGDPLSTESNTLDSIAKFSENEAKIYSLDLQKKEIERAPGLNAIKRQEKLAELDKKITQINKEQEAWIAFYDVIKSKNNVRIIAKIAVEILYGIIPQEVENYQNQLSSYLYGVDQSAATVWCRYFAIKEELNKIASQGHVDEFLIRHKKVLRKEMKDILDWGDFKGNIPTEEDPEDYSTSSLKTESSNQKQRGKQFPTPPGTEWNDISIHFVDMDNLIITIPKDGKYEQNYKSLDRFVNKKNKKSHTKGWHLLIALAWHRGSLPLVSVKENERRTKRISLLNKNLKNLFPDINGNPFKAYTKDKGWEPRITLSLSESLSKKVSSLT